MQTLIDTFADEGREALRRLSEAADSNNHAAFVEAMHALKGSGANVGAMRLVASCRAAEAAGVVAMRRDGEALRMAAETAFREALESLRALDHSDPSARRPGAN
jgi:HPt (histidine-containing phosphotransfer) domain-containing protein